jgi:hypothetical protein
LHHQRRAIGEFQLGEPMTFDEVLAQTIELLKREGRVSYRALKRRFSLDDEYLDDLKAEIIRAKRLAIDEDREVLVWTGAARAPQLGSEPHGNTETAPPVAARATISDEGERRQLTVMFCDLAVSLARPSAVLTLVVDSNGRQYGLIAEEVAKGLPRVRAL